MVAGLRSRALEIKIKVGNRFTSLLTNVGLISKVMMLGGLFAIS